MRNREMPGRSLRARIGTSLRHRRQHDMPSRNRLMRGGDAWGMRFCVFLGIAVMIGSLLTFAAQLPSSVHSVSAAQVATPWSTPSPCAGGENLIPDPGFESGAVDWFVNGSVEPTTAEAQSGSMAIRLGAPDANGYMDHFISSVVSGATYELSGWGKLSSGGEMAEIGVQLYDSSGDRLAAEEPAPLVFTDTDFVEQRLRFTASDRVVDIYVYLDKESGAAQFFADSLSLTICQTPEGLAATPVAPPLPATPIVGELAGTLATPSPQPLVAYVDADLEFAFEYPADWRQLTEDEIRAQLDLASDDEIATALATTRLVVVSPDGQAAVSLSSLPRRPGEDALTDVVQALQEADAIAVIGMGEVTTDVLTLDGREAVRLSFRADDPTGGRLVRQLVTIGDDATIVLAFVVRGGAEDGYEETLRQIEQSWRWDPQP